MARGSKNYDKKVRKVNKGNKSNKKIKCVHNMIEALIVGDADTAVEEFSNYMKEASRDILLGEMKDDDPDDSSSDDDSSSSKSNSKSSKDEDCDDEVEDCDDDDDSDMDDDSDEDCDDEVEDCDDDSSDNKSSKKTVTEGTRTIERLIKSKMGHESTDGFGYQAHVCLNSGEEGMIVDLYPDGPDFDGTDSQGKIAWGDVKKFLGWHKFSLGD